jgi:hypothetical protein
MVSLQRDGAFWQPRLEVNHIADDAGTFRSAVDVIAEKDERYRPTIGISIATCNQSAQLGQRAVNIADGADKRREVRYQLVSPASKMAIFRQHCSVSVQPDYGNLRPKGRF